MRALSLCPRVCSVAVFLLLVFTSGVASATASSVTYDPSLGTLPDSQGWTFYSQNPGPAPQVAADLLHLGPTGDTAAWGNQDLVFDLNSLGTVVVVEATLQVVSSSFTLGSGGTPRAGYEISMRDTNGRGFTLLLSDNQLDLVNSGTGSAGNSVAFDTTDGFHTYRLIASADNAQLFVDGNGSPLLSASTGDPGWSSTNKVIFGDGTSAASSETYMAGISFNIVPEPSTALLLGIGMAGLGMRRTRRGCC